MSRKLVQTLRAVMRRNFASFLWYSEREKNAPHSGKPEEIGRDESERYQASGMGTTTVDSGRFMSGLAETVNHPMIN